MTLAEIEALEQIAFDAQYGNDHEQRAAAVRILREAPVLIALAKEAVEQREEHAKLERVRAASRRKGRA